MKHERDHERQIALLSKPPGEAGSGAKRYAAAMYLYQRGEMSAELLEIYRRCCKFDDEDPVDLAAFEGIEEGGVSQ
ncbi:MAG: hypothetical protein AAF401_03165 [Pseudomonadota bacterium]